MTSEYEARRAMDADLAKSTAAFNAWMTAGFMSGCVSEIKAHLDHSTEALNLAIEKCDDAEFLKKLKVLSIGLDMVKISVAEIVDESKKINEDRLADYSKLLRPEES